MVGYLLHGLSDEPVCVLILIRVQVGAVGKGGDGGYPAANGNACNICRKQVYIV